MTDVHYLVKRQTKSAEVAITAVTRLLVLMEVCTVDRGVLEQAITLGLADFEDAVQMAGAVALGLDAIVTHDVDGFGGSPLPVFLPEALREHILQLEG